MLDAILVYVRETPLWQLLPTFVFLFVVLLMGIAWLRKSQFSTMPTVNATPTYAHYGRGDIVVGGEQTEHKDAIANEYNPGPVSIPEDKPYVADHPRYIGSDVPIICLVPYKTHETVNSRFDDPATTIKVESAEDAYLVVVGYEVLSVAEDHSANSSMLPIKVRVQVIDEGTKVVMSLDVYGGEISVDPRGAWRHVVSGNATLSGLPEGVYGLNVLDYVTGFDHRENARREYSNMRLRVTHQ